MVRIGKIVSTHGVKGDVVFVHQLAQNINAEDFEALMIEINPNSFIPFFIENYTETSDNEWIVKFEEIANREEAIQLVNKNVAAPPTLTIELEGENKWLRLINYTLINQENKPVGIIQDFYVNGIQILLSIEINGEEKLIPFSEELIINENPKKKLISIHIADGLLEI